MGYDRSAPKREINLSLNEDLVRQASKLTTNFADQVERLLADFVTAEGARHDERERQIDQWIDASNAFIREHGIFGEEHSSL